MPGLAASRALLLLASCCCSAARGPERTALEQTCSVGCQERPVWDQSDGVHAANVRCCRSNTRKRAKAGRSAEPTVRAGSPTKTKTPRAVRRVPKDSFSGVGRL
ncbi:hypothetical protein B0T26DRAFT_676433 [Lasiosphaeria miniovina]|uniref:Secreted protein n=1 Tax=Lasiosphaeria miniovina TaxID=1954250 RepID=A0AA40ALV2_9PEZI|nr:uncharacterized protein B0T26DRAFT_676433 [Lasiosphaeria miniovina]KAK0718243.1 hypothetical protein B0T26DRAFT_676433 [Lasiosphaeria miniovina]